MEKAAGFQTRLLSSLSKVFADEELRDSAYRQGSALRKETYSFQLAFRADRLTKNLNVAIDSELAPHIEVQCVGLAPSELPCYDDHDDFVLRTGPGLYPDPLYPARSETYGGIAAYPRQWRSLWISVDVPDDWKGGLYPIRLALNAPTGETLGEETFELEIIEAELPDQRLIRTEWFHADCLATYYGVDVFSELHWELIGRFVDTAARHGVNMILTPLFTAPLDTAVGGERPTVQLVDVIRTGSEYAFGFEKLQRWVELCQDRGIRFFELSHLFTQWGAKHAPKIMARVDGGVQRIFGWETDASGDDYVRFLRAFLPALTGFIRQQGWESRCYFHVSDEPSIDHAESYRKSAETIRDLLNGFPIIDALSDYAFYERGLVRKPIPSNDHIETFIENGVDNLWTYYCCSQYKQVSNRFFHMPSLRNRIAGWQFYKFRIEGFLHWGYNFWYSQYSIRQLDPFRVTDAGGAFPSGDAFLVYPGAEGRPIESIRLKVFREALQDMRALERLESLIGRERTLELLEEELAAPLTFTDLPRETDWLLRTRERVNARIREAAAGG